MDAQVCINGTSVSGFSGLCEFGCHLGYCPIGACVCTRMGEQRDLPEPKNVNGYPGPGKDANYAGLCAFDCNYNYCPEPACATFESPLTTPLVSPFSPPACISGRGPGNWGGLCSYACNFGFCPIGICICTGQGALNQPPPITKDVTGSSVDGSNDFGLCDFACSRDYCPDGACKSTPNRGSGSGTPVSINPSIWEAPNPVVSCIPPCVLILPPYRFPETTIITFLPFTTTLTQSWITGRPLTTKIVVIYPPVTTTEVCRYLLSLSVVLRSRS